MSNIQHYVVVTESGEHKVDAIDQQDLLYQVSLILGEQTNTVESDGTHTVFKDQMDIQAVATVWDA